MNELEEKQELTLPKQKKKIRLGKKGRVAVVLLVGARLSGHASCDTYTLIW